jgi:phage terminase large subunit
MQATMAVVKINKKFEPLFRPIPGVRYYIVTGGRAPGKSFAVATAVNHRTYDSSHNVLFTRYSMVSADISIIPEFTEKMEICGNRSDFDTARDEIENLISGSTIYFKGILQSRKNNDARLKSVQDVALWVLDEAQELTDEKQFDIIDFSIRTKGAKCEVWLVLNPTDVNHWIYRRFFKEMGVADDFNGVVGDVCYIHTTYLENLENLDETFIAQAEKMKAKNYEKYKNVFLGYWERFSAGVIFQKWVQSMEAERMTRRGDCWYGIDWGFSNDPTAIVRIWRDADTEVVYLCQVCYKRGLLIAQIADILRADMEVCGSSASLIYCDPARPEHIAELRRVYNLDAVPAVNKDKPGRVDWVKGCDIVFWGDDIEEERSTYSYLPSPVDPEQFTNVPQDGGDHLMDAANYGVWTHLHRLGVPNSLGQS